MSAFYNSTVRYYDAETSSKTDDLLFYSALAEQYGAPILDVGCGTGRVVLHLAQEGHATHGIDDSEPMLERLKLKLKPFPHLAEQVTVMQGDVLKAKLPASYNLILLTYNCLMHFHDAGKQRALLTRLRQHIAPQGRLVLDLPNAGETFATQDTDAILLDRQFIEPESGNLVLLQSHSYLDRTEQLLHVKWIYDEIEDDGTVKRLVVPHILRYFFLPELSLLLEVCGFEIESVYGDVDPDVPFEDGSERMVVIAKAR